MRGRIIVRNSLLNGLDLALSLSVAVIVSVLVARWAGPEILGEYNYFLWIVSTATMLAQFGIAGGTCKFAAEAFGAGREEDGLRFIRFGCWLQVGVSLVMGIALLAYGWWGVEPHQRTYALLAVASAPIALVMGGLSNSIAAKQDFLPNVLASMAGTTLNLIMVLVGFHFNWGLVGLTLALFASRVLDYFIRYWGFRRLFGNLLESFPWRGHLALPPADRRRFLNFCIQALGVLIVQAILWSRSEVWFLKRFWGHSEVSYYTLGFNFIDRVNLLPTMITYAVTSNLLVEYGRGRAQTARVALISTRYLALASFPLLAGLAALSSPLVVYFYLDRFRPAILPLLLQCILLAPRMLLNIPNDLLVAANRQSRIFWWGLIMCVVNLSLDYVLIRSFGSLGAAWANGAAQAVATVGMWYLALKEYQAAFPAGPVLRIAMSAAAMGLGVAAVVHPLPPLWALIAGVPLGMVLYPLAIRLLGGFQHEDYQRWAPLAQSLPAPARLPYLSMIRFLAA